MPNCIDHLVPIAQALIDCLSDTLVACGVPVCRASMVPGATAAFDLCCACDAGEGQAWVLVRDIASNQLVGGTSTMVCAWEYTATLEVGIVRCAASLDATGAAPSAQTLDDEAASSLLDAALMREAITCCWPAAAGLDRGDWTIGAWTALGVDGGCRGGATLVTARFSDCRCQ